MGLATDERRGPVPGRPALSPVRPTAPGHEIFRMLDLRDRDEAAAGATGDP